MPRKRKSAWTKYILAQLLADPQSRQPEPRSGARARKSHGGQDNDGKSQQRWGSASIVQ